MKNKHDLGQFYTTNYKYIFRGLSIPKNTKKIIEPFCGNGDLLKFIPSKIKVECYDIEPKIKSTIKQDTIKKPPKYKHTFVITNPPYLARNKSKDKTLFDKYNENDLYKCFLRTLVDDVCDGGILILPLNFISSIRKSDCKLRKDFFKKYQIIRLNIFEEQVFKDTTYTVCSFEFVKRVDDNNKIETHIYPSKEKIYMVLNDANNYIVGGDIYNLEESKYKVSRLLVGEKSNTNILLKAIDDNPENQINLSYVLDDKIYYGINTSRTYASIQIEPNISIKIQKYIIKKFNKFLNKWREKYHSLFLVNYRESKKGVGRKRISFDLVYKIISNILIKYEK